MSTSTGVVAALSTDGTNEAEERFGNDQYVLLQALKVVNEAKLFGPGNEVTFVSDRASLGNAIGIANKSTHALVAPLSPECVLKLATTIVQSLLGDLKE
jgi:hypothetical protein